MKKMRSMGIYMVLPALLVCCLGYMTLRQDKPNGFLRKFKGEAFIVKTGEAHFDNKINSICGIYKNNIFFSTNEPGWIYSYSTDLLTSKLYNIGLLPDQKVKSFFRTKIDSNTFSIFAGNVPAIIKGSFAGPATPSQYVISKSLFTDIIEFQPGRFVIRAFDNAKGDFVFQKIDATGQVIGTERNVSIPTQQGGITTQGTLLCDHKTNRLFYVYRLFNKIQCFDTSLNLIYSGHTIDTIAQPILKSSSISKNKGKFKTYGGAPLYTNYRASISDGLIYINSLIKADNEPRNMSIRTFDVYDMSNGSYQYSFHLPPQKGRVDDFLIKGGDLFTINIDEKRISKYSLNK